MQSERQIAQEIAHLVIENERLLVPIEETIDEILEIIAEHVRQ